MFRGGYALVMVPKSVFERFVFGAWKFTLLNALMKSPRNRRLTLCFSLSTKNLVSDRLYICIPGPRTIPAPEVPQLPCGAGANAAGLIHPCGPGFRIRADPPRQSATRPPMI